MIPHRLNINNLPEVATAPEKSIRNTQKTPLRTCSRRSLKRRHTSPSAPDVEHFLSRTESLTVTGTATANGPNENNNQQSSRPIVNAGRKRMRFSLAFAEDKTPSNLAWEALASSAPVLARDDDDLIGEQGSYDAHVVECSLGHQGPNEQHPLVEDTLADHTSGLIIETSDDGGISEEGTPEGREETAPRKADPEAGALESMSLDEYDGEEDSSEPEEDEDADTTALTPSSEGDSFSFPATSGSQKPKVRGRFLIFDRSPPKGFKVLHKPRVKKEADPPLKNKRKTLTDGFTEDEARPSFLGKRRRLQHLDINVGSLDLTQSGGASQQRQRNLSPKTDLRTQSRTAASLWRGRQYFSASQFKIESQGSVKPSEVKKMPTKTHKHTLNQHNRQIPRVDNFRSVIIPRTDSPQAEHTTKAELAGEAPGELVWDSSPIMHLLPKQRLNGQIEKSGSLTLRPGPPGPLEPDLMIPETPVLNDDALP
ncbi:hypothetical protein J7T55_012634 [Diaporthe amygdali]|uniref:uncharacterized protein n=1 Tax=Phomopsis amygdali TaxID=1214568 RepID=UPI0022FE725E|nr:uncharacterized protein J7T55_012634 [Diaporthe amygdali]KAJ0115356.1 hypothetical protein J7T55_012634 [Diaporthe amygdali]